jgi:hypothetical protein
LPKLIRRLSAVFPARIFSTIALLLRNEKFS